MRHDFDGFTVNLILDDEGDWQASFVELPNVSAFSSTPARSLAELKVAWVAMKKSYEKHGDPLPVAPSRRKFSGRFNVRVDKRIHRALAMEAAQVGISLNALISQTLTLHVKSINSGAG